MLWLLNSKFIVNVSGVCLESQGRVLLLRHRFWPEGTWGIPGGYVHSREVVQDGLTREVREETNLSVRIGPLLRVNSGYRLRMEIVYLAEVAGGVLRVDNREILEARFFSPEELPDGLLPAHRQVILEALARSRGIRTDG